MPDQELAVAMDVGSKLLVKSNEVLISAPRVSPAHSRRAVHQALDSVDEVLLVAVLHVVPFNTDAGVLAGATSHMSTITGDDRGKC